MRSSSPQRGRKAARTSPLREAVGRVFVALLELFLRLVPQECVGSLWSKQDRKCHERACPTVRATVAQFSLVAKAVVSSCLGDTGLRAAQRARLLEKWIRVAEECFCLQNFSSLYAIISALQSTPLHRLKRTWEKTSRDSLRCYEELSAVCSEEDNYSQSRRLLFQVGATPEAHFSSSIHRALCVLRFASAPVCGCFPTMPWARGRPESQPKWASWLPLTQHRQPRFPTPASLARNVVIPRDYAEICF
nr:ral guanine nucleotide dissociation stimulator-like 2 isoform X1 [Pogona vitticeps]